jgi:hypothetical protein
MHRFSIRILMAVVLVSAVGLAALRNANELWAGVLLTIVFLAIASAVMGALILRGGEQYAWAGFAVFGGCYLAMTLAPGLNAPFKAHFGTTALLNYVQSRVEVASPLQPAAVSNRAARRANLLQRIAAADSDNGESLVDLKKRLANLDAATERQQVLQARADQWRSLLPGAVNAEQFLCVGHSLFTLLAGLVGGTVARWFYARRERAVRN